jgi:hypothetical protein
MTYHRRLRYHRLQLRLATPVLHDPNGLLLPSSLRPFLPRLRWWHSRRSLGVLEVGSFSSFPSARFVGNRVSILKKEMCSLLFSQD